MSEDNTKELFNINFAIDRYIKNINSNSVLLSLYPEAINYWLKVPEDKLKAVNDSIGDLLRSITLFDDNQDSTLLRRHSPCTNRIYGNSLTFNASIYLALEGLNKAMNLGHEKAPEVYIQDFLGYMDGQALDIYWRDNFICPTEEEFKMMCTRKSGSYFWTHYHMMQLFSDNETDYSDFLRLFSFYYHIRDDYTNVAKVEALEHKSLHEEYKDLKDVLFCDDITEGRFTWYIIHALNSPEGPTVRSILVQHTRDKRTKQYCLSLLEKCGSIEYTRQTLRNLDRELRERLFRLGGNPIFTKLLDEMNNWDNK